jgi:hypothetical protein
MNTENTKHTPGPWEAVEARVYQKFTVCGQPSSRLVCSCSTHSDYTPWSEQNANARLIASAPELLAACSAVAEDCRLVCNLETGEKYYPITPDEMGAIRRAIAKAGGVK